MFTNLIFLTVLLPLLGFLVNSFFGRKIKNEKIIGIIGSGTVGLAFLVSLFSLLEIVSLPVEERKVIVTLFQWFDVGNLDISFGYQVDPLSLVMSLIVTGVGFLIHVYSIGYMHGDKGIARFFAYLNLFIFMMMNLVLADNFVLLFLGWEGVGLCSYLLIGFWYDRKFENSTTADAAKKAFVVNRIGDFGFMLGMFLIYMTYGSLNFSDVFLFAEKIPVTEITITLITLFLFIGAIGKSAQIPLFVWLPDAMAGPTPVSALIHAATMVTAGVYMVSRCSILFVQAETTMMIIAIIGLGTAFVAATIGLVQNDIKKVLAYSTVSQLGFMFLALGVGAFTAGIFHLMTHAFFKALLFLGAGSVIHALKDEQDIRKMGGLKSVMPKTYWTFLAAALAISGIPPLSGFFSKDEILWKAFSEGSTILYVIAVATAMMTAFYIFRLFFLTFEGKKRWYDPSHPHESPSVMTIPLIILGILSVIGGFIGMPALFVGESGNFFAAWLAPVFEPALSKIAHYGEHSHTTEILLMILSAGVAAFSIYIARKFYLQNIKPIDYLVNKFSKIYKLLFNKYWVDEAYDLLIVNPIKVTSEKFLWKVHDVKIIDGFLDGTAALFDSGSKFIRKIQTGVAQFYALVMVFGIAIIIFILFIV
ncbi:MAG: NADH-quinone oxidoreductase subunit L [Bacteroidetes bacterium]|nr:NADH-quinone oxidoreductase subunit L [Bacteroidota bacterium]MBU2585958.1 NADH-quinone oxidoreductase subunit L [Bacteroidota bacterium]